MSCGKEAGMGRRRLGKCGWAWLADLKHALSKADLPADHQSASTGQSDQ